MSEKLEREIRTAFNCKSSPSDFSKEELDELKWDLGSLDEEAARELLPILMIEVGRSDARHGDALVYFLDGNLTQYDATARKIMLPPRREVLGSFTQPQANVVLRWLKEFALNEFGDLCPEDLASAISYWSENYPRLPA